MFLERKIYFNRMFPLRKIFLARMFPHRKISFRYAKLAERIKICKFFSPLV